MRLTSRTEEEELAAWLKEPRGACPDRIEMDYPEWLALCSAIILLASVLVIGAVFVALLGS